MVKGGVKIRLGSEWRCGNCGKIYTFDDFIKLEKVKLVESDTNPEEQHGYTSKCECGYRFHLDKWRFHDKLSIKIDTKDNKMLSEDRDVLVSTIDLELNHGWLDKDLWYETMIFIEDEEGKEKIECYFENRYETKEDAINDHNRIVNLIKDGKYTIEKNDETVLRLKEE